MIIKICNSWYKWNQRDSRDKEKNKKWILFYMNTKLINFLINKLLIESENKQIIQMNTFLFYLKINLKENRIWKFI